MELFGTTADADATSNKNDELNRRYYEDDWTSAKDGGPEDGRKVKDGDEVDWEEINPSGWKKSRISNSSYIYSMFFEICIT